MFGARITFRQNTAIVLFLALRSRRRSMGAPFSLQSKRLQPDYVSSSLLFIQCVTRHRDKKDTGYLFDLVIIAMFRYKNEILIAEGVSQG